MNYGPYNSFKKVIPTGAGEEYSIFADEIARRNRELENLYNELEDQIQSLSTQQGYERIDEMKNELLELQQEIMILAEAQQETMDKLISR